MGQPGDFVRRMLRGAAAVGASVWTAIANNVGLELGLIAVGVMGTVLLV